jgi:hypothetical protein
MTNARLPAHYRVAAWSALAANCIALVIEGAVLAGTVMAGAATGLVWVLAVVIMSNLATMRFLAVVLWQARDRSR